MLTLSVVLPYYNEAAFLPDVLACARAQDAPPHELILVDNGSTDGSRAVCERTLGRSSFRIVHRTEPTPGKIAALTTGCGEVSGDIIVFWDADTFYPPSYLRACAQAFRSAPSDTVAVCACAVTGDPASVRARLLRHSYRWRSRLWPRQVLTGGFAHAVRRRAFRQSGGFNVDRWPYVLIDHEIMHRLARYGRIRYDAELWCRPSGRRHDRRSVRWSLTERLLYHLTPFRFKDWYFYRFLGPRLARRGLSHLNLREQPWQAPARELLPERPPPELPLERS